MPATITRARSCARHAAGDRLAAAEQRRGTVPGERTLTSGEAPMIRSNVRIAALLCAASLLAGCSVTTSAGANVNRPTHAFLDTLALRTFHFFWNTTNAQNGLTPDRYPTR